ncbi:MAG: thiolase C-terminal domain-containing protein [Candidatus Hodarchaeales archaeon]
MTEKVCLIGGATTPFDYGPTGFESIEEGAANCLREIREDIPEFSLRDVDAVIYSHFSVHFGQQLCAEWIIHDHLGLVGIPHFRVENGGNTGGSALYAAALAIMSGHHKVIPVIGWETMDSVSQSQGSEFIAIAADMRYELMVGGIYPIFYAAMAYKWMKENNVSEEDMATIGAKNRNNAMDNPKAQWYRNEHRYLTVDDVMNSRLISYPIKKYDCCLMSRGVAAAIICNEEYAKKVAPDNYTVIDGMGLSSCTIRAGDRLNFPGWDKRYGKGYPDMTEFAACRNSAETAYKMAGIKNPLKEIHVGEIHDAFSTSEAQIYKALGFCDKDNVAQFIRDGVATLDGDLPVNPGGGLMGYGHPVGATGLMSMIEAHYQLTEMIPDKHLSSKTQVKDAEVAIVNSHAGTGTSISNFILRRH